MPRELAKAGFEVSLLTPRNSLTEKSRFVDKVTYLPDKVTFPAWAKTFVSTVQAGLPRLVLPCDDTSFRLLAMFVLTPQDAIDPPTYSFVASLIRRSLGDPRHYRTSVDKTLLIPAAETLGIRVPPYLVAADFDAIDSFAATQGYAVVLKGGYGSAGDNVIICSDARDVEQAFASMRQKRSKGFDGAGSDRVLVQAHVSGASQYYSIVAWSGKLLAGFANDKVQAMRGPKSAATVVRLHRSPEVHGLAEKLVQAFDMSGILSVECIIDEHTGEPYLLEINRRFGPSTFRGGVIGVDLCAALHAAVHGLPSPTRIELGDDEASIRVNFPQEWLRDPRSEWLRNHPVDVPWDDPGLIKAMLALRNQQ